MAMLNIHDCAYSGTVPLQVEKIFTSWR
uniref:Uncharacterized protein n=1 Tax=Anguilla anguilla TaxID=7936 RepID=A0A0E9Q1P4_ANGAN